MRSKLIPTETIGPKRHTAEIMGKRLEAALRRSILAFAGERLPQEPFLTEEICAPCSIPRPVGQRIVPAEVVDYIPKPHDVPEAD